MTREAWYSVHLYAYLAVALAFAHQLAVGTDFSSDRVTRVWWISLYVAVLTAIVLWRVGRPLWFNARHRLRIHSVRPEANGVVSLYLTGERLDEIECRRGPVLPVAIGARAQRGLRFGETGGVHDERQFVFVRFFACFVHCRCRCFHRQIRRSHDVPDLDRLRPSAARYETRCSRLAHRADE